MSFYENTITGDEIKTKNLNLDLSESSLNLDSQTGFSIDLQDTLKITRDCDLYIDSVYSNNMKPNYHNENHSCILMSVDNFNIKTYSNDNTIKDKIFVPHSNTTLTEASDSTQVLEANHFYKIVTNDGDVAQKTLIAATTSDFADNTEVDLNDYFFTDQDVTGYTPNANSEFKKIITNQVIHKGNKINYICSILPMKINTISGNLMFLDGNPVFNSSSHRLMIEFLIKPQKEEQKQFYDTKPVPSKSKYPDLSAHYSQLEAKFGDKQLELPFMSSLYENINYLSYGLDKKVLVLKLTNDSFDANKITFSVNLIDDLIIENTSDIFIDATVTYGAKINTGVNDLSFVLKIDQFNIKNNSNLSVLNNGISIPNETSSVTAPLKSYTHKAKKLNYVSDIVPTKLSTISGSLTNMNNTTTTTIFNDTNDSKNLFIIEFLFIKQKP